MSILYYYIIEKRSNTVLPSIIVLLPMGIQHGAARMTSNSSKNITTEATEPNSPSEESERKGRTKPHQKITLPIFEKKTIQEAKLWRRRIIQYVKMTQVIDPKKMTTDKEILLEFRDELEVKIKDIFIWASVEAAVTEMTKTVRDNDPNKMIINQLYALF